MTADDFRAKYTLGRCVHSDVVRTFSGTDVFGAPVLIHLLPRPEEPDAAEADRLLSLVSRLPEEAGGAIIEVMEVEGRPVVATRADDELTHFRPWLEKTAAPLETTPGVEESPEDMGELTRLFAQPILEDLIPSKEEEDASATVAGAPAAGEPTREQQPGEAGGEPPPEAAAEEAQEKGGEGPQQGAEEPQEKVGEAPEHGAEEEKDVLPAAEPPRPTEPPPTPPEAEPLAAEPLPAESESGPGEFTRLFGSAEDSAPAPAEALPPEPAPSPAPPAESAPGLAPPAPESDAGPSGPGEMTRLFSPGFPPAGRRPRATSDSRPERPPAPQTPTASPQPAAAEPPAPREPPPAAPRQPEIRPREEFLESSAHPAGEKAEPDLGEDELPPTQPGIRWSAEPSPPRPSPPRYPPAQEQGATPQPPADSSGPGEFTRLFGGISDAAGPAPVSPPSPETPPAWAPTPDRPPPAPPAPAAPGRAGDDAYLSSLADDTPLPADDTASYLDRLYGAGPESAPPTPSPAASEPPPTPPPAGGPSDYTRIIAGTPPPPPSPSAQPLPPPPRAAPGRGRLIVLIVAVAVAVVAVIALVLLFALRDSGQPTTPAGDEESRTVSAVSPVGGAPEPSATFVGQPSFAGVPGPRRSILRP